ncbi:hypothetical protein [Stappia sp.]|uniref:hypothetical protein n=1 Tax=Stappia sp. TaxID=1870903 RepID=UPI0032D8D0FE
MNSFGFVAYFVFFNSLIYVVYAYAYKTRGIGLEDFLTVHGPAFPGILLMATAVFSALARFWMIHLDRADDRIVQLMKGVYFTYQRELALSEVTAVVIRRRPTLILGRICLRAAAFEVDLSPPGFLLPGQRAAAREIAEFLGVPLTDERGHIIPYRA